MVLFPGDYATINEIAVTFHYYTQDYLGNNRAVINGSTGAIEQTVAYYPYGGIIPDLGNPHGGQPYRFGGKELITANGLNEYDFGARQYYPTVPGFTKPDPCCEISTIEIEVPGYSNEIFREWVILDDFVLKDGCDMIWRNMRFKILPCDCQEGRRGGSAAGNEVPDSR